MARKARPPRKRLNLGEGGLCLPDLNENRGPAAPKARWGTQARKLRLENDAMEEARKSSPGAQ